MSKRGDTLPMDTIPDQGSSPTRARGSDERPTVEAIDSIIEGLNYDRVLPHKQLTEGTTNAHDAASYQAAVHAPAEPRQVAHETKVIANCTVDRTSPGATEPGAERAPESVRPVASPGEDTAHDAAAIHVPGASRGKIVLAMLAVLIVLGAAAGGGVRWWMSSSRAVQTPPVAPTIPAASPTASDSAPATTSSAITSPSASNATRPAPKATTSARNSLSPVPSGRPVPQTSASTPQVPERPSAPKNPKTTWGREEL